ncbi:MULTISPECIES: N-acetylmuramoyl-L-alanine amidase [unclassified Sphingobacterium]|uniref:N-acetylmuramoyl-L-alanine amidase n=1 Tax=unclassified Sphingobacterium TaxID=2609468 RepID=UPI001AE7D5F7|nr:MULTISPECIES: peptidoglycan recognition family protein [unclassified Sphingobacterium]MDR6736925.1 N-acetyl-anhydromuramyl-L-alanine amidase AmpD [Sphingobacterium sp. 2149]
MRSILLVVNCLVAAMLFAQSPKIIQKPITWNQERIQLSLDYLKNRHGLTQSAPIIHPKMIVVHWTANNSVKATFNTFNPVKLPGRPELTKASALNVSSQFVIDRDGTIYQFLPDSIFARHTIGLNYCAIGIENIGSRQFPLTNAQLKANEELIRYLSKKYPIEFVLGHHEYQRFKKTSWWKETDPNYITGKDDPGDKFMNELRSELNDLKLKRLP